VPDTLWRAVYVFLRWRNTPVDCVDLHYQLRELTLAQGLTSPATFPNDETLGGVYPAVRVAKPQQF